MNKNIKTTRLEKTLKTISTDEELNHYISSTKNLAFNSFAEYFQSLPKVQAIDKATLVKESGLERTYCYHILNGSKDPGRDKILCLCIAAKLNITETNRALKSAHYNELYVKNNRDAIIQYAIQKQLNLFEINSLLSKHHEAVLD